MVKFGGHVEAIREGDFKGTNLYLIPYNKIKKLVVEHESEKSTQFIDAWQDALSKAEDDFQKSRQEFWGHIFSTIGPNAPAIDVRGAHPGKALKLFVESVQPDQSQGLLFQLMKIKGAATTNSEGLRKLVKKFDKYQNTQFSLKLLPDLFTSSLYSGQSMLQDGIDLFRQLLEDSSLSQVNTMIRNDSEAKHARGIQLRFEELEWLRRLCLSIPKDDLLPCLVAHRGFHNIKDRNDKRPLENSLSAFETAWTSGIHLCECDIAVTKDEKLVLAHDDNFSRLALDSESRNSTKLVGDLTFRELMSLPLKSGIRPPLLIDVLRSALAISDESKLVIEIKPGNEIAASSLARLLIRYPDLRKAVAMIMSFDAVTMHRLQAELNIDRPDINNYRTNNMAKNTSKSGLPRLTSFDHFGTMRASFSSQHRALSSIGLNLSQMNLDQHQHHSIPQEEESHNNQGLFTVAPTRYVPMPKLMLLTVSGPPKRPCELQVGVQDLSPIENWLRTADGSSLDGVYLQFQNSMMTPEGAASLQQLSERFLIGVWGFSGKDPDDYETLKWLVRQGNCSYVNTDLPHCFRNDILVQTTD